MKPVAYNYLGEPVFQSPDGSRAIRGPHSAEILETPLLEPARFLRIDPKAPESHWLCSLAFAFQPGPRHSVSEFFSVCAPQSLLESPAALRDHSRTFLQSASIAYFRRFAPAIDGRLGHAGLMAAIEFYSRSGLGESLAKTSRFSSCFSPIALSLLRLALKELAPIAVSFPFSYFNIAEGLVSRGALSPSASAPWPLTELSGLSSSQIHSQEALPDTVPMDFLLDFRASSSDMDGSLEIHGWPQAGFWADFSPPATVEALLLRHSQALESQGKSKLAYLPLSKLGTPDSTTPLPLLAPQAQSRVDALLAQPKWDEFVGRILGFSPEEMAARLSPEQIDACGMALLAFQRRGGFILADETGKGKGRILAGLARAFLMTGRRVFFVTERRSLFTDFWRDLIAVGADEIAGEPFLLHPHGKIFSADGDLLFKAKSKAKFSAALAEGPANQKIILSTYSQFNRDLKGNPRWSFALEAVKDGALLILDESHNAAGASNTRKNFLEILSRSRAALFSSATFAKHEEALALYQKAIPISSSEMEMMLASLPDSRDHTLARAMSQGLTQTGYLIRREHADDASIPSRLVDISEDPAVCSFVRFQRQAFAEALDALFRFSKAVEMSKMRRGESPESMFWARMGGLLARLARQHNLLCKIESAGRFGKSLFDQGMKPVFALESTFEAFISSLAHQHLEKSAYDDSPDPEALAEDAEPARFSGEIALPSASFADLMRFAAETIAPEALVRAWGDPDTIAAFEDAHSSLSPFADLPASPLDSLSALLGALGVRCGEISGRSLAIRVDANGSSFAHCPPKPEREQTIRQFNHGGLDALIITRAGAAGLSLHADASYSDQRPRAFIELEVSSNPAIRVQFLGRVRRRGQVVPPSYFCLTTGAPFERRQFERAQIKQSRLSGFTSAIDAQGPESFALGDRLISSAGDRLALEWLSARPDAAMLMGIDPGRLSETEGPSEKVLKRLPLLSADEQDAIFDFLLSGLALDADASSRKALGFSRAQGAVLAKRTPFWGLAESFRQFGDPFSSALWADAWIAPNSSKPFGSERASAALSAGEAAMRSDFPDGIAAFLAARAAGISPGNSAAIANLRSASPYLKPGASVRFADPAGPRIIEAMILRVSLSDSRFPFSPSLWALDLIIPGEPDSFRISLGMLFSDPHCYFDDAPSWPLVSLDRHGDKPLSFLSISGHCVYSRWWLDRTGAGKLLPFSDSFGLTREQVIIEPYSSGSLSPLDWPIPLLNFRMAIRLLQSDPRLALQSAFRDQGPSPVILRASEGGWSLSFLPEERARISEFALDRKLGPPSRASRDGSGRVSHYVSSRDIYSVLALLQSRGVVFFAPPTRSGWHSSALLEILRPVRPARASRPKKPKK